MDNEKQKKDIIIKEITFWKESHLLPDHYCDFLTQLYTGGKALTEEQEQNLAQQSILQSEKPSIYKSLMLIIIAILTLVMVTLMFIFGNDYVWIPTVSSVIIFTVIAFFILKTAKNPTVTTIFAYATAALLLFAISVRMTSTFFPESMMAMFIVLLVNCIIWIVVGKMRNLIYFTVSGILGVCIIIIYRIIL